MQAATPGTRAARISARMSSSRPPRRAAARRGSRPPDAPPRGRREPDGRRDQDLPAGDASGRRGDDRSALGMHGPHDTHEARVVGRLCRGWPRRGAARPVRVVRIGSRRDRMERGMTLEQALEALIASEPFERLLLERARPIAAHAGAGEDAVIAGLARALDVPVLAVAPGPHEAEALAAEAASYLGDDRVAFLPAWEALPYEGIGPTPEISARRADAVHRLRAASGAFVVVAPALAAMQGLIPTLGAIPPLELVAGLEPRARHARRSVGRPRVRARGPGRASRRVRGAGRRGRRVPRRRATTGPPGVLGRGGRVAPRVRIVHPAVHGEGRERARAGRPRADPGRRDPRARRASRAAADGALPRRPAAHGGRPVRRGRRDARPVRVRSDADDRGAAAARRVGGAGAGATDAGPGAPGLRGGRGAGRGDRLAGAAHPSPAPGRARGARPGPPVGVHAGARPRAHRLGERPGQPRRARGTPRRSVRARLPAVRLLARSRFAGTRAGVRGRGGRGRCRRGAARERLRLGGRQGGRRHRGGLLRLAPSHADRAAVHAPPHRLDRRRARAGRLRRPPDPRRRPVRRHHAPRARRRGARLPDPGVRAGRQAVRAERPGRHGRAIPGRRRAATAPARRLRLGQGHHQGQARREGHGRRARPSLQRPHVGARATRSGPTRRGSTSWRTRSRTTRPATSSPRSRTSSTTWSCPSPWTA